MFAGDSNSKIKSLIKELKNKKPDKIDSPELDNLRALLGREKQLQQLGILEFQILTPIS